MDILNLKETLLWLMNSGGSVVAASWILERLAWFKSLSPENKEWTFFGVASAIGLGAYSLFTFAPDLMNTLQPFFIVVAGNFLAIFVGKVFHGYDKLPSDNSVG